MLMNLFKYLQATRKTHYETTRTLFRICEKALAKIIMDQKTKFYNNQDLPKAGPNKQHLLYSPD